MNSEEQHRREGEPPKDDPSPREEPSLRGENGDGAEALPAEEAASESLETGEDPGVVPEAPDPKAEEEEPETDPEEESEIAREEILALAEELEVLRKERDGYLDNARRMKAELENSRKRQEKERARFVQLASERLVKELLPVLDNLDRALEVEGDIREGIKATRDLLFSILGQEGLTPVASDGQSFDPVVHEAVMSQPSDEHEEDTILQTLERGYVLNGKPIRPAKVVVSKQV
ncbi:MAG TPA: nucleotide exchange factor GrpE [Rubrobacteraceae bacterium]|nr:nucleotide exchange factor GrpE [Rubrobacteraceae bacterium]